MPLAIVDTHTHAISDDPDRYPLNPAGLPGAWYREAPHTAEELIELMDAAGVERAVLVQGVGAYSYDNRYVADAVQQHRDRLAGACCIDVLGESPLDALDYWIGERGLRGLRLFALSRDSDTWLDDPSTYPVWERASALGAHIIVTILYHQIPALRRALAHFPGVAVSLDHCAFPPLEGPPWTSASALFDLAEHPNLHLKLTTNVLDSVKQRGSDPRQAVAALVDRFGARRIAWGSDFCQTHDRPYEALVAWARHCFGALDPEDQACCLGGTARRIWS